MGVQQGGCHNSCKECLNNQSLNILDFKTCITLCQFQKNGLAYYFKAISGANALSLPINST